MKTSLSSGSTPTKQRDPAATVRTGTSLTGDAATDRTRRQRFIDQLNWPLRIKQVLMFGSLIALWEGVVAAGLIDPFWVSQPTRVAGYLWELVSSGDIVRHLFATLQATFLGFGIGLITGVLAGALLGYFRTLSEIFDPLVMALYSLPRVALAPLFIIYFGIGVASKVALAVTLVFFLVLLNTRAGVRSVDDDLINAVRTMGAGRTFILRRVVVPATVPWIIAGARSGIVFSLMAVVVGEMLVSRAGLGRLVTLASDSFNTTGVFGILVIMASVAIALNWLLVIVERYTERYTTAKR